MSNPDDKVTRNRRGSSGMAKHSGEKKIHLSSLHIKTEIRLKVLFFSSTSVTGHCGRGGQKTLQSEILLKKMLKCCKRQFQQVIMENKSGEGEGWRSDGSILLCNRHPPVLHRSGSDETHPCLHLVVNSHQLLLSVLQSQSSFSQPRLRLHVLLVAELLVGHAQRTVALLDTHRQTTWHYGLCTGTLLHCLRQALLLLKADVWLDSIRSKHVCHVNIFCANRSFKLWERIRATQPRK